MSKKSDNDESKNIPSVPSQRSVKDIFSEKGEETIQLAIQKAIDQAFSKTSEHPKKNEVKRIAEEATVQIKSVAFEMSGPLPMPALLERYEKVLPGSAERIMKMAEDESHHRRSLDKEAIDLEKTSMQTEAFTERLGSIFALIIGIVCIVAGAFAAMNGSEKFGITLVSGTLGSLVLAFILGRKSSGKTTEK